MLFFGQKAFSWLRPAVLIGAPAEELPPLIYLRVASINGCPF